MSKRFTETEKWRDPWFRKLSPLQKCLFAYLCDNCNNAGFIEIDIDGWACSISCKPKELEGAWQGLGRSLVISDGWAFVRGFLKHQKHLPLCPEKNKAHQQIVRLFSDQESRFPGLLKKVKDGSPIEAPSEGLGRGIGIGIGIGQDNGISGGVGGGAGVCGVNPVLAELPIVDPLKTLKPRGELKIVLLTDEEIGKLLTRYTAEQLRSAIAILESYLASNPKKKYASHYAVMKQGGWVHTKVIEQGQSQKTSFENKI